MMKLRIDWMVETASELGPWGGLGLSGTVFGPVAQGERLGDGSGPKAGK